MAVNGHFTYYDLYAGKPNDYHYNSLPRFSFPTSTKLLSVSNATAISHIQKIDLTTTLISSSTTTRSISKWHVLARLIPFAYCYWFLVALAVLVALTLTIVFIGFCRSFCKNNKSPKRPSLPSFSQCRKTNQRIYSYDIYEPTVPTAPTAPVSPKFTPPCPSKALHALNDRLLRQGLDAVGSPQTSRIDVCRKEPLSTFTSTASNLLAAAQNRLNARSSDPPLTIQQLYETQRATMALNDDSMLVDIE